ncbi:MAG: thermonuclease family protein, partial [Dehalococcoidia bacterium]
LEKDVSETDGLDALLRYAWLEDGKTVNSILVAEGYAKAAILPPDTLYAEQILTLEEEARRKGSGLWAYVPKEESTAETGP